MSRSRRWVVGGLAVVAGVCVVIAYVAWAFQDESASGERIMRPGVVTTSDDVPDALFDDAVFLIDQLRAGQLSDETMPLGDLRDVSDPTPGYFNFGIAGARYVRVTVDPAPDEGSLYGDWFWDSPPDRRADFEFVEEIAAALRADGIHIVGYRCQTVSATEAAVGESDEPVIVQRDVALSGAVDLPSGPTTLRGMLAIVGDVDDVDSIGLWLTNGDPGIGMPEIVELGASQTDRERRAQSHRRGCVDTDRDDVFGCSHLPGCGVT